MCIRDRYFEHFCQISSKLLLVILSYTVLKLRRFFETQCVSTKLQHCLRPDRNFKFHLCPESRIAYLYICVVIVTMTTQHYNLASHKSLLLWRSQNIRNCVTFLYISSQPPLWSWTWLYRQKANETQIPTIYCPYGNIVNFSCTSRIHFSANNTSFRPFKPRGRRSPMPGSVSLLEDLTWKGSSEVPSHRHWA